MFHSTLQTIHPFTFAKIILVNSNFFSDKFNYPNSSHEKFPFKSVCVCVLLTDVSIPMVVSVGKISGIRTGNGLNPKLAKRRYGKACMARDFLSLPLTGTELSKS